MINSKKVIFISVFILITLLLVASVFFKNIFMQGSERSYQVYNENNNQTLVNKDYYLHLIPLLKEKNYDIQNFIIDSDGNRKGIQIEKKDESNFLILSDKKTNILDDRYAACKNKKSILSSDIADIHITYHLLPGVKTEENFNGESSIFITYYFSVDNDISVEGSIPPILNIKENYQNFDDISQAIYDEINNNVKKYIDEVF